MRKLFIYFFAFMILLVSTMATDTCTQVHQYANLSVTPCHSDSFDGNYEYTYKICNGYSKELDISTNSLFNDNLLSSSMFKVNNICTSQIINATTTLNSCYQNKTLLTLDQSKQKIISYQGATIQAGTCQNYLYKFKPNSNKGKFDINILGYDKGFLAVNFTLDPYYELSNYSYWRSPLNDYDYIRLNIPANTTLYMSVSNTTQTKAQNGVNTFDFFDDFNSGSLDTTKWTQNSGISVTDGFAQSDGTAGRYITYNTTQFNQNVSHEYNFVFKAQGGGADQPIRQSLLGVASGSACAASTYANGYRDYHGRDSASGWILQYNSGSIATATATGKGALNTNYTSIEFYNATYVNVSIDALSQAVNNQNPTGVYYSLCVGSSGTLAFDNYRAYRKFVNEPKVQLNGTLFIINNTNGGNFGYYTLRVPRFSLAGNLTYSLYNATQPSYVNVEFLNQTPQVLNLFNVATLINITYNITSDTNITSAKLYYNVTKDNSFANNYLNGTATIMNGSVNNMSVVNSTYGFNVNSFQLSENNIFPSSALLSFLNFNQTHQPFSLTGTNDAIKIKIKGLSNSSIYYVWEMMINTTSLIASQPVYFCNSSYSSGNPATSGSCTQIGTFSNGFNHCHNLFSCHNLISFTNINNSFNGVKITDPSYYVLKGGNSYTPYYVNNISNLSDIQISGNGGISYSNALFTFDEHTHAWSNETLNYFVCANSTNAGSCSVNESRQLSASNLPPSAVNIISPINGFYGDSIILVNYTASSAVGATITNYQIDFYDSNLVYSGISHNNSLNLTYRINTTIFQNKDYYVFVTAYDNYSLSSVSKSELFTINNTIVIAPKPLTDSIDDFTNKFMFFLFMILFVVCYIAGEYLKSPLMMIVSFSFVIIGMTQAFSGLMIFVLGFFAFLVGFRAVTLLIDGK